MYRPQHISGYAELQDKLHKLAMARDSLILQIAVLNEHCKAEKLKLKDISSMADRLINYNNYNSPGNCNNGYISQNKYNEITPAGFNRQRILLEIERLQNHVAQLEISKLEAEAKLKLFQSDIEEINSVCGMSDRSSAQILTSADSHCRNILKNISLLSKSDASRVYNELLNRLEDYELYSFYNQNNDYEYDNNGDPRYLSNEKPSNMTEAVYSVLNKLTNQTAQEIDKLKDQVEKLIADNQQKNVELLLMKSILMVELQGGRHNNALAIRNMLERLGIDDSKENITHSNSYPVNLAQINSPIPSSTSYNSNLSYPEISNTCGLPPIPPSFERQSQMASVVNQLKAELNELRHPDSCVQRNLSYDGNHNSRLPYSNSSYSMSLPRNSHKILTTSGCGTSRCDNDSIQGKTSIGSSSTPTFKRDRTRSTFKNLIGRLKRSSSQNTDNIKTLQMHKSVSSRFCSPSYFSLPRRRPSLQQFIEWTSEQVGEYLGNIGFAEYMPKIQKNIRSGRHFLNLCDQELEKELGIKNNLHLKRLRYNLNVIEKGIIDDADHVSVSRVCTWLEDFGLPHLREIFQDNMIDGPMFNNLTAKDLIDMKIISAIHHASIARGIQYLRENDFNIQRLENNPSDMTNFQSISNEVKRWSQNATCQWLKSIDLVEFTPNIFGQGIHGALMIYEPTFTAESLCDILCIPPQKTLLRRHVISHFNGLLGQNIITHKREVLSQPLVSYLSPLIKVKIAKKQFLNVRKKSKYDVFVEADEYVCPKTTNAISIKSKRADFINSLESSNV